METFSPTEASVFYLEAVLQYLTVETTALEETYHYNQRMYHVWFSRRNVAASFCGMRVCDTRMAPLQYPLSSSNVSRGFSMRLALPMDTAGPMASSSLDMFLASVVSLETLEAIVRAGMRTARESD
ncbi:hypothetical protein M569_12045 [Genlisea aurea]|uniref:Uncharacterized protein n=1 Tax=Genlisea aurea TaxID=192259 RepID=S8C7I0_9LAMI|nr:hypothetical protein M569_12045 [Genlisea aurea]